MDRLRLKALLEEYTLEDILESADVEPLDALEYLVSYGVLTFDEDDTQEDA